MSLSAEERRERTNIAMKRCYNKNPDKYREKNRSYRKNHPLLWARAMCKCHMKKIGKEEAQKVFEELFPTSVGTENIDLVKK